jgi:hypothetical protein
MRLYCNKAILQRKEKHPRRKQLQQKMMNSIAFLAQAVGTSLASPTQRFAVV